MRPTRAIASSPRVEPTSGTGVSVSNRNATGNVVEYSTAPSGKSRVNTPFSPVWISEKGCHPPRHTADDLLREICVEDGMSRAVANTIHRAVRAFGGSYWDNKPDDFHWMAEFARHPSNQDIDPVKFGLPEEALELL